MQKDTCVPIFTATLLTTARTWKQPECHWGMNGWRRDTHTQLDSPQSPRMKQCHTAAIRTDLEIITLSKVSQREKDKAFPGGPVVNNLPSNTGDVGLIPGGQETKIPRATGKLSPRITLEKATSPNKDQAQPKNEDQCHTTSLLRGI